ncbi:F-box domain-containing protein [Hirschfeldia incana]|nr:F-box domain-containing protein [Hirschfeldia incana]
MSNSNSDESPENYSTLPPPPPPPPSLSSLPDEIVVRCIALVPRSYHLSLSWVSKHLRSLVRSPELNTLRSTRHKKSLHVCFEEKSNPTVHWLTLRPVKKTETETTEYRLVPNPTPFPSDNYGSSTVAVGSKIFFTGEFNQPSSDLWILDTRTGNMTQGPSMSVPRVEQRSAIGVIDGKIYVIGGGARFNEEIQVEVFDPKSETWELAGVEKVRDIPRCSVSVEGKVYMVEYERTSVYDPRECEGERFVKMESWRLEKGGRKEKLTETTDRVCVVEDVLFAFFNRTGLMWFDAKVKVWRRLVGRDGKEMFIFHADAVAEYNGKLAVLFMWGESEVDDVVTKSVRCKLVSVHRARDRMCGTVDWSGVVGTVPDSFDFLHCLAVSD